MHQPFRPTLSRRALASAASASLLAATMTTVAVGTPNAASAEPALVPVEKDFSTICDVTVDDLKIPNQAIEASLATAVEFPLVPGSRQPSQDVSVTLTMPKSLQKATKVLKVTHAEGHSPDSAVDITLPVPAALGGTVTNRIPLVGLSAPRSKVPGVDKTWEITSTGKVPAVEVPGFAGDGNPAGGTFATFKLAPTFTIKANLIAKKKTYRSTMSCTVNPADLLISDQAPIAGAYKTDAIDVHKGVRFNHPAKVQLVMFNAGANPANSWTEPDHGTLTPSPDGLFTYTPDEGYAGPDSFTYTAKDDSGHRSAQVILNVKRSPSMLTIDAQHRVRRGHPATAKVGVESLGSENGPITVTKGGRIVANGRARDGKATLTIRPGTLRVGKHDLTVRYAGNATTKPGATYWTLRIRKP